MMMRANGGDGACVEAFYRAFASFEANSLYKRCECVCEQERVCVSGGGDNSVYGGERLVLLVTLLAGHHFF